MSERNDGGSAFPTIVENWRGEARTERGGMKLRDYFAAKAMPLALSKFPDGHDLGWDGIARLAYLIADAMLKAREE